jgi:hypothetical protein
MSQVDRQLEFDRSASGPMESVRDAGSDVAHTTRDAAVDVAHTTRDAAVDVARTAKQEARQLAHTTADEVQEVGRGVRQRLRDEVDRQHRQVTDRVGAFAEELYTMARERPETPAGELVGILAARSRTFAEYLDQHGPERVLHELRDFARRRPGTFIVSAVAAGFVVGRLGKGLWQKPHESPDS